jgi:hypothetical protein
MIGAGAKFPRTTLILFWIFVAGVAGVAGRNEGNDDARAIRTTRANSSPGQADGLLEECRPTNSLGLNEMTGLEASLAALRQIFLDAEAPPRARIEAAETILSYEAPADLIQEAKGFLIELLQDQEMSVSLRLEASKILRKAEAPKQDGTVASVDKFAEREMARDILKAKRRLAIHLAGLWPPPPGYCADLDAEDFDPLVALEAQTEAERAEKERLAAEKASKNKKNDH